jgi:hypothetical protein
LQWQAISRESSHDPGRARLRVEEPVRDIEVVQIRGRDREYFDVHRPHPSDPSTPSQGARPRQQTARPRHKQLAPVNQRLSLDRGLTPLNRRLIHELASSFTPIRQIVPKTSPDRPEDFARSIGRA